MNKVILIGRLTKSPDKNDKVTRFTLAADRKYKREGEATADFISCVAFGKTKEFIDKYFSKGMKMALEGRIQTGSYEKDGKTVYTTDVVVEGVEFAESKKANTPVNENGFVEADDTGLPFV